MILIIIKFCELLLRISPRIINSLRSYIKHSKECFLLFPNTSKLVKKNSAAPRFSNLLLGVWKSEETLFLVFDLLLPIFWNLSSNDGDGNKNATKTTGLVKTIALYALCISLPSTAKQQREMTKSKVLWRT